MNEASYEGGERGNIKGYIVMGCFMYGRDSHSYSTSGITCVSEGCSWG